MAKRRGNSEGSVFIDKDGVWWAQLPPDEQGKRPKRRAKTQKEAIAKLRELQQQRKQGLAVGSKLPTFEGMAQTWLDDVMKRRVRDSTFSTYSHQTRCYLASIASIRVDRLTTPLLQHLINEMDDEDYAIDTIRGAYRRLVQVLDTAVDYRYIAFNPALAVRLPRKDARKARALPVNELQAFLALVEGHQYELAYHLMITLGLRRGEAFGVSWRGIDWENATLKIDQQVQSIDSLVVISPWPKTSSGLRTLPIPPLLLARLRVRWQAQQLQRQLPGWKEHGLIVTDDHGGSVDPRGCTMHFSYCLQRLNLEPARLHDLRHSCATSLGALGTLPHVVGAILGHSPKSITEHYTHATVSMMRESLERHEAKLFATKEQKKAEG